MPQINRLAGPPCVRARCRERMGRVFTFVNLHDRGRERARFSLLHAPSRARASMRMLNRLSCIWCRPAGERNFHLASSLSRISRHSQLHITLAFLVTRTHFSTETVGWRTDVNNSSSSDRTFGRHEDQTPPSMPIFVFSFPCFCFFAFGIHSSLVSGQTKRRRDWHAFAVNRECTVAAVEKNCGNQI